MDNNPPKVYHYHLVAGEIIFRHKEDEPLNAVRLNTVIQTLDGRVAARQIGLAQQSLQKQFFKNMNDATLTVIDVVILLMTNLGQFTQEQFHARPEGMTQQEIGKVSGNA
jgi:hypothetical protein